MAKAKKRGRPTLYSKAIADEICARISEGEPLRKICREENMPAFKTVYDWMNKDNDFSTRITRARKDGYEAIAESCLDIADDGRNDWMEVSGDDGTTIGWRVNGEHIQRSKVRIETRLKLLAKWFPAKYGDKQSIDHSGEIKGGTVVVLPARKTEK